MGTMTPPSGTPPRTQRTVPESVFVGVIALVLGFGLGRLSAPNPSPAPASTPSRGSTVASVVPHVDTREQAAANPEPLPPSAQRVAAPDMPAVASTNQVTPPGVDVPVPAGAVAQAEKPSCVIEDFVVQEPDSVGDVWCSGEVRNIGTISAKVQILIKAYSSTGVLIDSKTTYADRRPLPPGEKTTFRTYAKASGQVIKKVSPEILYQ